MTPTSQRQAYSELKEVMQKLHSIRELIDIEDPGMEFESEIEIIGECLSKLKAVLKSLQ